MCSEPLRAFGLRSPECVRIWFSTIQSGVWFLLPLVVFWFPRCMSCFVCVPFLCVKKNQMEEVVAHLDAGHNVAVEAVPGAGKTHIIMNLCRDGVPTLILAYNRELADRVNSSLDVTHNAVCFTFHGLCSRCLGTVRDDHQLLKAVSHAEAGRLIPENVPHVQRVVVDEAQDVRELYVRLLCALGLSRAGVQIVVAGDRNQLVYDFDDDFPASLATLGSPETAFGTGTWRRVRMETSRRLTEQVSHVVNRMFETNITSAKQGPPVEVRVPTNMYSGLYESLKDLLRRDSDVLILVDRKSGNRALRSLLNTVSRNGLAVHVHGVPAYVGGSSGGDGGDAPSAATGIRCGTFWSAKGLEANTVVVLLPGAAPPNPTYVALTRSTHRLVVVLDPKNPHPLMSRIVVSEPERFCVTGRQAVRILSSGARAPNTSFEKRQYTGDRSGFRCLDRHVPCKAVVDRVVGGEVAAPLLERPPSSHGEDAVEVEGGGVGEIAVLMGLVRAEHRETGVVRAMLDVEHPTRLDYDQIPDAIRLGLVSRVVPRFVTDDELLAADLRDMALRSYKTGVERDVDSLAIVALAIASWDAWDCTMRTMCRNRGEWTPSTRDAVEYVCDALPVGARYDVRLMDAEKKHHARVQATTPERAYHFVWEATSADVGRAVVRAALHPGGCCRLVDVQARTCVDLVVENSDDVHLLLSDAKV